MGITLKSDEKNSSGVKKTKREIPSRLKTFLKEAQRKKGWIIDTVDKCSNVEISRIPFGVFTLDYVTHGGIPKGRISLLYGHKSASKSTTSLRLIRSAQEQGLQCVYIDQEHAFDKSWAEKVGVDVEALILARPDTAEECIDIVDAILKTGDVGFLVLDSVAAMTPSREIDESVEKWQQGLQARLVNKAVRKWVSTLNALGKEEGMVVPTILLINQIRQKIGVMFGDPETTPGGLGVGFATSMELKMWGGKTEIDKESGKPTMSLMKCKVEKSKVSPPKISGEYQLVLIDSAYKKAGDVYEEDQVRKLATKFGIIKKESGQYNVLGKNGGPTIDSLNEYLLSHPEEFQVLKDTLLSFMVS